MAVDLAPALGTTHERPQAALDSIWRGPLVPVALAATAGIVADRYGSLSLGTAFAAAVVALLMAAMFLWRKQEAAALLSCCFAVAALAASYHHWRRDVYPADDISNFADEDLRPVLLR